MTPKEKAHSLVEKFKDYVHGYVGSSMLTNHEYPERILSQAKKAAMIVVDECLNALRMIDDSCFEAQAYSFYENVKKEIEQL